MFGVTGILGVNGLAAGFKVNFLGALDVFSTPLVSVLILFDVCYTSIKKLLYFEYLKHIFSLKILTVVDRIGGELPVPDALFVLTICCCVGCAGTF